MDPARPPLLSISLISAAILSYEILLVHLFGVIQPHHSSSLIISLAMLGFGLSGTLTTLLRNTLLKHFSLIYPLCLTLCGMSMVSSFLIVQAMPINGEQLFWEMSQVFILTGALLFLVIPFFWGGTAISLTFYRYDKSCAIIYGWDLFGAGAGSIFIPCLLFFLFPTNVLIGVGLLGILAATVAGFELQLRHRGMLCSGLAVAILLSGFLSSKIELHPSPYKTLQQYLQIKGSTIIEERFSPLGLIQVVQNDLVPIRHAPGLSLAATAPPPAQLGLFINGENFSGIAKVDKGEEGVKELQYLGQTTSSLPYYLRQPGNILLPGVGGGGDILQARFHGVNDITCVELNPQLVDLLQKELAPYSGHLLDDVQIHHTNIRSFLATAKQQYDLIQLSLLNSFLSSVSGSEGVGENYLLTVDAIRQYLTHLSPNGYLSITGWVKNPPRDTLKLLTTVFAAYQKEGVKNIERCFVLIRGWQTATLLVKRTTFTPEEIELLENFCDKHSFDIAYTFNADTSQVNRFNILRDPLFLQAARTLLTEKAALFTRNYKYNIVPATDNRPYFNVFFKWSSLREIWELKERGGAALLESGYLMVAISLSISVLLSFILIGTPLVILKKSALKEQFKFALTKVLPYFFLTGIGFLLVEIAFIQQFILYLGHPLYAFSLCVASFLVFGGLGSHLCHKLADIHKTDLLIKLAVPGIICIILFYQVQLGEFFVLTAGFPFVVKIFLSTMLLAPLALLMGMPFPLGLTGLSSNNRSLIPWAWGINGCGSVISSLSATLLAIHFGFQLVIITAATAYLLLLFCFPAKAE